MAIFRITVRTFQNDEHAALFLAITEQAITALEEKGIRAKAKMGVTQNKKHEVINWKNKVFPCFLTLFFVLPLIFSEFFNCSWIP